MIECIRTVIEMNESKAAFFTCWMEIDTPEEIIVSKATMNQVTSFKFRLDHFYKSLLEETAERMKRMEEYDLMITNSGFSEEKSKRQVQKLVANESEFLRLRRVRLGVDDFQTVQVIGKGAYGEVRFQFVH
jgi:protein-serine/threonine kinase